MESNRQNKKQEINRFGGNFEPNNVQGKNVETKDILSSYPSNNHFFMGTDDRKSFFPPQYHMETTEDRIQVMIARQSQFGNARAHCFQDNNPETPSENSRSRGSPKSDDIWDPCLKGADGKLPRTHTWQNQENQPDPGEDQQLLIRYSRLGHHPPKASIHSDPNLNKIKEIGVDVDKIKEDESFLYQNG